MAGIHEAMVTVLRDVSAVAKDQVNSAQGFKFRGVDDIVNAVGPALRKAGVFVVPSVVDTRVEDLTPQNLDGRMVSRFKTSVTRCVLTVDYMFVAGDGSSITSRVTAESVDSGDKAVAKAWSVAYRTVLWQTFVIPTGDRDPDHDTFEPGHVQEAKKPRPVQSRPQDSAAAWKGRVMAHFGGDVKKAREWWDTHGEALMAAEDRDQYLADNA
jgi:hypothetical protein